MGALAEFCGEFLELLATRTGRRKELAENIESCNLFLYFISPSSVASEHCEREVNYAIDQKKPLLVVHLEATDLPSALGMSLSSIQVP